jgi:folate-binding protein YgfZ
MSSPVLELLNTLGASRNETGAVVDFGDAALEYAGACRTAALMDRSELTRLEFRGRDRARYVHNLCTNNIKSLAPGRGCEAFVTDVHGKVLAYVRIFAAVDAIYMDSARDTGARLIAHFNRYLITEDVQIADRTSDTAAFLLVGPESPAIASAAAGQEIPDLPELGHTTVRVGDAQCLIISSAALGITTYEVWVPAERAAVVWQALDRAGKPHGLVPMGRTGYEALRVEAGLPQYGIDIDETNLPQEVGRNDRAISFTKGCYLGQETIARIDALGHVNRHLVGLRIMSGDSPAARVAILSADKVVGHVTSAVRSPSLGTIALGYVRRGHERPGTELAVAAPQPLAAVVQALPLRG